MFSARQLDIHEVSWTAVSFTVIWSAVRTDSVFNERFWDLISDKWLANDMGLTARWSVLHYRVPA